jgi:hypothetical protein
MADQNPQQQVQIRLDESKMVTTYANTIRTTTTADEIVLDFGLNIPVQMGPNDKPSMHFGVGSRVVMNWTGAKRLAMTLQQAVNAYEQHYGPLEVMPPQQKPQGNK